MGLGFPGGSGGKEFNSNAGDLGLIPELGRSLEKGMATHSSILAWEIPWTEEPSGLQSTGSQKVRHQSLELKKVWECLDVIQKRLGQNRHLP